MTAASMASRRAEAAIRFTVSTLANAVHRGQGFSPARNQIAGPLRQYRKGRPHSPRPGRPGLLGSPDCLVLRLSVFLRGDMVSKRWETQAPPREGYGRDRCARPETGSIGGRQGEEVRFAADSPLEEAVTSELVSAGPIPCYAGKIQGISSTLAPVPRISPQNSHHNQWFTSKFPTRRNRELIAPYQGIKSTHQGSCESCRERSSLAVSRHRREARI